MDTLIILEIEMENYYLYYFGDSAKYQSLKVSGPGSNLSFATFLCVMTLQIGYIPRVLVFPSIKWA